MLVFFKIVFASIVAIIGLVYMKIRSWGRVPALPKLRDDEWWSPCKPSDDDTLIKPFKIYVRDEVLKDLANRLENTRPFTPPLEGIQQQYGFNTNTLKNIIEFWKTDYKWREREELLNKLPQFTTKIQGLQLHFVHVKPPIQTGVRVLPLLILNGWPSSMSELYKIIPILAQPQQEFVFEVIAATLPGFTFSQAASKPGLGAVQMAVVLKNLMKRLGHDQFYVQGSDWGGVIVTNMATLFPENVLGLHSNMCTVGGFAANMKLFLGSLYPPMFIEKEYEHLVYPLKNKFAWLLEETGYFHLQSTKPDTIGVGLNESPAGLAAYFLEKYSTVTNNSYKFREDAGLLEKFTYDELLDNIMLYWVTGSITTSMRIYAESFNKAQFALGVTKIPIDKKVPCACARFPMELFYYTDWILKDKYTNLIQSTDFSRGGHFAVLEEPELLAQDIFSAVRKMEKLRR